MAVNESKIKNEVKKALEAVMDLCTSPDPEDIEKEDKDNIENKIRQTRDEALNSLSESIGKLIAEAVLSAEVTSVTALSAPSGPVTGTITNTVS